MKYIRKANRHFYMRRQLDKKYKKQKNTTDYFEKNCLGYSSSHKMNNARYNINIIFDKWYFKGDIEFSLEGILYDLEKVLPDLQYILNKLIKEQEIEYFQDVKKNLSWALEPDRRRGWESYGFKNIEEDLSYISDRWMASFRIQWIIDMIHWSKMKDTLTPKGIE